MAVGNTASELSESVRSQVVVLNEEVLSEADHGWTEGL